jgi:NAD-dependent DNA ligase
MKIAIPTHCPCCDYPLELVNDQLFCRNTACSAQLGKKLEHFAKTLGIKGLGPKTVEKLQLADITEIFYLDLDQVTEQLGSERVAEKLITEIDSARSADLATVLASFSIPLVGATAAKKLCAHINHIDDVTREACKQAGLGDKVTDNLMQWLQTEFVELREFLPFSFQSQSQAQTASSNGKTVCITGKLKSFKTKAAAHAALQAAGYQISDSVTKTTSYLVDEEDKSSTKRTKAESLGIPIITDINTLLKETN